MREVATEALLVVLAAVRPGTVVAAGLISKVGGRGALSKALCSPLCSRGVCGPRKLFDASSFPLTVGILSFSLCMHPCPRLFATTLCDLSMHPRIVCPQVAPLLAQPRPVPLHEMAAWQLMLALGLEHYARCTGNKPTPCVQARQRC